MLYYTKVYIYHLIIKSKKKYVRRVRGKDDKDIIL